MVGDSNMKEKPTKLSQFQQLSLALPSQGWCKTALGPWIPQDSADETPHSGWGSSGDCTQCWQTQRRKHGFIGYWQTLTSVCLLSCFHDMGIKRVHKLSFSLIEQTWNINKLPIYFWSWWQMAGKGGNWTHALHRNPKIWYFQRVQEVQTQTKTKPHTRIFNWLKFKFSHTFMCWCLLVGCCRAGCRHLSLTVAQLLVCYLLICLFAFADGVIVHKSGALRSIIQKLCVPQPWLVSSHADSPTWWTLFCLKFISTVTFNWPVCGHYQYFNMHL